LALWVLVAGAVVAVSAGQDARQPDNGETFADIVDHFKYGSIGTEGRVGIPYWVWRVLPLLFEDKLPNRPGNGYERLGFMSDGASHGRPIGTTYKDDRVALVGLNCATCHVGSIRYSPAERRQIVVGMPANQMDLQGYARFLTACANDPRFNASTLLEAIQRENPNFGFFKRWFYRWFVIGRTKSGILDRAKQNSWFDVRPPQGPGRVDTFNPYKVLLKMDIAHDQTVGTVDLPSLWNQRPRRGLWLHWDGNNNSVEERNKSAAIGAGATPDTIDLAAMKRIEDWILDLKPPAFPADHINKALAEQGARAYQFECASCHEFTGSRVGQVTPIAEIATDPERLDSFTAELAKGMNTIGEGKPWRFSHFRKTDGYANMPLDGIWLRAPYLHNGSVPTLRALLFPEERPAEFYRGYDLYDWKNLGFVSSGPEAERQGIRYSTKDRGNGNGGHLYGAKLDPETKNALLEYLKTR
jgi:mono/diheme cytochrome c family protein